MPASQRFIGERAAPDATVRAYIEAPFGRVRDRARANGTESFRAMLERSFKRPGRCAAGFAERRDVGEAGAIDQTAAAGVGMTSKRPVRRDPAA